MDVYFNGYGCWANQIDDDDFNPIGDQYEVGGVFKLRDIDEKTYTHTGNFNHVRRLLPSINNDDCEFKKIKELYKCANPDNNPKFIFMHAYNRNPAFYCMDFNLRRSCIAIDHADIPTFLISINKSNKVTALQDWHEEQGAELNEVVVTSELGLSKIIQDNIKPNEPSLKKRDKQKEAILDVIKAKRFSPMAIPDGEKGTIKSICELENKDNLFDAPTAFDSAWKDGIGTLWKMEFHDSYAHRGNN